MPIPVIFLLLNAPWVILRMFRASVCLSRASGAPNHPAGISQAVAAAVNLRATAPAVSPAAK